MHWLRATSYSSMIVNEFNWSQEYFCRTKTKWIKMKVVDFSRFFRERLRVVWDSHQRINKTSIRLLTNQSATKTRPISVFHSLHSRLLFFIVQYSNMISCWLLAHSVLNVIHKTIIFYLKNWKWLMNEALPQIFTQLKSSFLECSSGARCKSWDQSHLGISKCKQPSHLNVKSKYLGNIFGGKINTNHMPTEIT